MDRPGYPNVNQVDLKLARILLFATASCLFHHRPSTKSQLSVRYLQALANMSTIFDNM